MGKLFSHNFKPAIPVVLPFFLSFFIFFFHFFFHTPSLHLHLYLPLLLSLPPSSNPLLSTSYSLDRLYFLCVNAKRIPSDSETDSSYFFTVDTNAELQYIPFDQDFGPNNIGQVVYFSKIVNSIMDVRILPLRSFVMIAVTFGRHVLSRNDSISYIYL